MRSQKLQREKVNFKLRQNEIGKYPTAGITINDVPDGYLDNFTSEQIERAKQLKAKQWALYNQDPTNHKEPNYSDSFYLDYAKSLTYEDVLGRLREINKRRVTNCEIQDVYWAQYSYEEIIQMEQDGYQIPQDVLEWAHAQQQADVTDYIVLSDSSETDDNSETSDSVNADELSKHRAQTLKDIAKVEKANEETEKDVETYKDTRSKAKSIRSKNAIFKDIELKKLKEKTEEWKKLNEKNKSGKLNKLEQVRFRKLSNELKESDNGLMAKIESNTNDLDEFLKQMDKLGEKINENEEIISETIQHAKDLTDIEKNYAPSLLPVPMKGIIVDGNGLSTSTLYGIRMEDLSKIAIEKSEDLDSLDIHTNNSLASRKTQKIANFAKDYVEKAKEVTEETKVAIGESEEKPEDKDKKETKEKEKQQDNYKILKVFSAVNATASTAITIEASADMLSKQNKSEKQKKVLNKELDKSKKDVNALEKNASSAQTEHQNNLSREEQFLMQLDELNSAQDEQVETETTETTQTTQTNQQQNEEIIQENNASQEEPDTQNDTKSAEKAVLIDQINNLRTQDNNTLSEVIKASGESKKSTLKSKVFANMLRGETATFEQARKTLQRVSKDTTAVGVGTTMLGYANTVTGGILFDTGSIMTTSIYPPTVVAGLKMMAAGVSLINLGQLEIVSGIIASETGIVGNALSATAKSVTTENAVTDKTTQVTIKDNEASIAESENAVGIESTVEVDVPENNGTESEAPISEEPETAQTEESESEQTLPEQENMNTVQTGEMLGFVTAETSAVNSPNINEAQNNSQASEEENNLYEVPELQNFASETKAEEKQVLTAKNTVTDVKVEEEPTTNTEEATTDAEVKEEPTANTEETTTDTEVKEEPTANTEEPATDTEVEEESSTNTEETTSETNVEDEENNNNTQERQSDKYRVENEFSAPNAVKATDTTINATSDMVSAQVKAIKEQKNLEKATAQADKDVKTLAKEASSVQSEHQTNLSKKENFITRLEELNAPKEEPAEVQSSEVQPSEDVSESQQVPVVPETTQEDNSAEKTALVQNIASIQENDDKLISGVNKASEKGKVSVLKSKVLGNALRGENTTFEQARKTAEKVSGQTIGVGIGTVARGYVDGTVGANMMVIGTVMMHSIYPPTVIAGMGLFSAGSMLFTQGVAESLTGTVATGTGFTGVATATAAEFVTKEIFGVEKNVRTEIKSDEASIAESEKSVGIEPSETVEVSANNEEEPKQQILEEPETVPAAESTESGDAGADSESGNSGTVQASGAVGFVSAKTSAPNTTNVVEAQTSEADSGNETPEPQNATPVVNGERTSSTNKNSAIDTIYNKNETDSNSQSTEVDGAKVSEEPKARKAYEVEKDFSIFGAAKATITTIKATQDVLNSRSSANKKEISFRDKLAQIRKISDSIEKNKVLAEAATKQQEQKSEQTKARIENENLNIQKAAEEGDVQTFEQGQINVKNLAGSAQNTGASGIDKINSNILSMTASIGSIQNDRVDLKSELTDFNNKINEQLNVSQDTMVVGGGTFGVGFARGFAGMLMVNIGMSLEATAGLNVAQHILALAMMLQGTNMVLQGGLEEKSGILATATGGAGLAVHTQVKGDKVDFESTEKTGNSVITSIRNGLKHRTAEVQELDNISTTSIDEVNLIAASATANANSVDKAETDDKADRKLVRFNKETEIESRKKRKRVNAVSASARG